jgi:hypothetical protein
MAGYDGRGSRFPLVIVRGADLAFSLTVVDDAGAAISMATATIEAEVYDSTGTVVVTMTDTVSGVDSNIVTLSLTDTQTTALTATSYSWTMWVTRGADRRPWLAGQVTVTDGDRGRSSNGANQTLVVDTNVNVTVNVAAVGPDAQAATEVSITDAGGYYTGTNVETALAEVGVDIAALEAADALRAPIANPTFTGNVIVPDADAATEAMNRQTSDARYPQSSTLTTDGDILTRTGGVPARITRASLAADSAFTSAFAPGAIDQFVDPFPAWFGGGTVNEGIADIVTHMDAYVGTGTGSPLGVVTGNVGDRYIDTAATNGARVWYKASGAATNTGWLVAEGDTGWRTVASWTAGVQDGSNQMGTINTTGFTLSSAGTIQMRRVNERVLLHIPGSSGFASSGTSQANLFTTSAIASGFQGPSGANGVTGSSFSVGASVTTVDMAASSANIRLRTSAGAGTIASFSMAWITADAWPTSLPGVAA